MKIGLTQKCSVPVRLSADSPANSMHAVVSINAATKIKVMAPARQLINQLFFLGPVPVFSWKHRSLWPQIHRHFTLVCDPHRALSKLRPFSAQGLQFRADLGPRLETSRLS